MDPLVIIQWQLGGIAILLLIQIWLTYFMCRDIRNERR